MTPKELLEKTFAEYSELLVKQGLYEKSIDRITKEPAYSTTLKGNLEGIHQDKAFKNKYSKI